MNFTVEEFLDVFERYNELLWPLQIVACVVGVALVALALTQWKRASAAILGSLSFMWAGMAVGYMWLYFADINPAAKLFGVLFLAQAALLTVAAVRERGVAYGGSRDWQAWVGLGLIAYGMVAYPLLGMTLGHGYPHAPMFGLMPCPTAIFTFGMLLLAARPRRALLWLPLAWSVIGFCAALRFGIREDAGLLVAGIVTAIVMLGAGRRDLWCRSADRPARPAASPSSAGSQPCLAATPQRKGGDVRARASAEALAHRMRKAPGGAAEAAPPGASVSLTVRRA